MPDWIVVLSAGLATLGFAVLFNAPPRTLLFAALVGAAGQAANLAARRYGFSPELSAFLGGLTVGLLAGVGARLFRTPATVFTVTGFISLVPGALAFRSVEQFLADDVLNGLDFAVRALLTGGAIAAGLGVTAAINQVRRR